MKLNEFLKIINKNVNVRIYGREGNFISNAINTTLLENAKVFDIYTTNTPSCIVIEVDATLNEFIEDSIAYILKNQAKAFVRQARELYTAQELENDLTVKDLKDLVDYIIKELN